MTSPSIQAVSSSALPGLRDLPGKSRQMPALDGLRTLAIIPVIGIHLGYLPGGFLGVTVFFVLSGFLITSLLLDERVRTGQIGLRAFYVRRLARLYPALIISLVATGAGALLSGNGWEDIALMFVISIFYLANVFGTLANTWLPFANHTWTLAQEEQFYLVAPKLIDSMNLANVAIWGKRLILTALGLGAARLASIVAFPSGYISIYENPVFNLDAMLAGVGLAFLVASQHVPTWLGRFSASGWAVAAAAIAVASTAFTARLTDWTLAGATTLAMGATVVALLHVTSRPNDRWSSLLSNPVARWVGQRSYGIYLYHVGILQAFEKAPFPNSWWGHLLQDVGFLTATLLVAAFSYRFIEGPIRDWARKKG
jgi:peptidoglycan/LPS O-acetylase OafA/YrhL